MISPARTVEPEVMRPGTWAAPAFFWLSVAIVTVSAYWLCLRLFFPGYFDPLSPFHVDFYDYVAQYQTPVDILLKYYPRPAAFISMHLLASSGLDGLMAGTVAIALLNVLLTLALVRKALRLHSPWLVASFAVYTALLFAHPQFYAEHRHDLPAELSYLYLAISLLCLISWVQLQQDKQARVSSTAIGIVLLTTSVLSAVLFAFTKETYFVSALCIVAGLAIAETSNRWRYGRYLVLLLALEICSLAWTRHINSPFVNPNAAADSSYRMSLLPSTIWHSFHFYVSHLLNPAVALIVILALVTIARDGRRLFLGVAFSLAGLAAFAPLSLLPNHLFEEYAWAGASLFLAPVLLICEAAGPLRWRSVQLVVAGLLTILAIAGPGGYRKTYRSPGARWIIDQERRAARLDRGLSLFQALPRPSRILVVGLEDATVPWQSEGFLRFEFGERLFWTIALPRRTTFRRNSRLVRFADVTNLELRGFDFVATYQANGTLASIRSIGAVPTSQALAEVLVPALSPPLAESRARPQDYGPLLQASATAIEWGLWTDAGRFLDQAHQKGATDSTYQRLVAQLQEGVAASQKPSEPAELTAQPAHIIQPDGSGFGVAELFWKVPDGVAFEIHVNEPGGPLFSAGENSGHARTQKWVTNGMEFFLQDVTGGKSLVRENTLAHVKVSVSRE
jgi:hypothetical protein